MNRALRFRRFSGACRSALLAVALVVAVGACGRGQRPIPPSTVPRPTTMFMGGGHVTTADLWLHEKPRAPAPGWM